MGLDFLVEFVGADTGGVAVVGGSAAVEARAPSVERKRELGRACGEVARAR